MSDQTAITSPICGINAVDDVGSSVETAVIPERPVPLQDEGAGCDNPKSRDIRALQRFITTAFGPEPSLFVAAASPPPMGAPKTRASNVGRRVLKAVIGASLVAAFGLYPVYTLIQPSSVEAVLNARVVTLRSPINGRIDSVQLVDDASVIPRGSELLKVHADRADRGRLNDLERQRVQLTNEQTATDAKLRHAKAEQSQLQLVVDRFRRARVAQISSRRTELEDQIAMAELRNEEAVKTFHRSTLLVRNGNLSEVELTDAARQASITSIEVHSLKARMSSTEEELLAARAGVFTGDSSNNDRPSSFQRAETVRSEIAALMIHRDQSAAEIERVSADIVSEAAYFTRLSGATLSAPVDGRVWERLVSQGEEVSAGQALVRLVDCSTSVITANVTEQVYNRLAVGAHARFIPNDDGNELSGQIINLTGLANAAANFAIEPSALSKSPYRIMIAPKEPAVPGSCSIGRTGRVVFEKTDVIAP